MILSFAASSVVMAVFLALLIGILVPLGQLVGFYLDLSGNAIRAYSVNLVGSVTGLWTLAVLSFLWLPPGYWFGLSFLLILILQPSLRVALTGLLLLGISLVFLRDRHTDKEQCSKMSLFLFLPLWPLRFCGGEADSRFVGGVDHA